MKAILRYLIATGEKPVYFASTGGAQAQLKISAQFEEREVSINNARELSPAATLDAEGFTLASLATKVADFYQFDSYRDMYEVEITETLLQHSGAFRALIFDHTLRSDSPQVREQYKLREPASVIHNDYTDASAEKRLRDLVPPSEAEQCLRSRFSIVNVWRTINRPVESSPLTCCDARSIAATDLVASERRAKERIGELQLVSWNPAHRWYWFPKLQKNEAVLIKTFDSSTQVARRSIHSAFVNSSAPENANPRESIESRALLFF